MSHEDGEYSVRRFERDFFTGRERFTFIGSGELGGKAHGLARASTFLSRQQGEGFIPSISVAIPRLAVITTEYFDLFMRQNDLFETALSGKRDDLIAHAFLRADLPTGLAGDLRAIVEQVHTPLAVRSSSMLEDAMFEPFASVYATKMVPNNLPDSDSRFHKLAEAVKFVYASTFFKAARNYMRVASHTVQDEKMAVIVQEIAGSRFGERFYPHISGVMRSFNFYPFGRALPEDGIVELALGLGKTIVDEGVSWAFSPAYPATPPPFKSTGDMLKGTQTRFWAVNMGKLHSYNPVEETEYLERFDLKEGEYDGAIDLIASTYDYRNDKVESGTGADGPRIIDFGPLLRDEGIPLAGQLSALLKLSEERLGGKVEIEFAIRLGREFDDPVELSFLQVRPMVTSGGEIEIGEDEMTGPGTVVSTFTALGNGEDRSVCDIVYLDPERFDIRATRDMAVQLEKINRELLEAGRPYMLIGFGRWGTTDPLGGVPVDFGQISGAKIIVESSLPNLNFMLSQGSHFFHNVTSFKIFYLSVRDGGTGGIDWDFLGGLPACGESGYVRHVRLESPLLVKVDGRSGTGVVLRD